MSLSFLQLRRYLALGLCAAACGPLAGCRVFGQGTTPSTGHETRPATAHPFSGTWHDGPRSSLTVAPDGTVTGTLTRPSTGLVFDRPETAGVVRLDVPSGTAPVRLASAGAGRHTVVVRIPSAASPAETLTLTFRVNHRGDQLRVLARSERREETYHLTRGGTGFARAE
jgi:hypothetical protein